MHDQTTRYMRASAALPMLIVGCIVLFAALIGCASTPPPPPRPQAAEPARELGPCELADGTIVEPDHSIFTSATRVEICGKYTISSADYAAIIGKDADHERMQAFAALFADQSPEVQSGIAKCAAHWANDNLTLVTFARGIGNYVCPVK